MQQSKNYKANLPEGNNVIDISVLNKNITDIIDKGLILDVGDSTGNANNYVLNLGSITLSSANKGISFKFWADKNSTGAVKINGTYNLVDSNLKPVKNVKAGVPYTVIYDGGTNFFLASGSTVDYISTSVTSDGKYVLEPHTFIGPDGEVHTGTMKNKGAVTASLNCGGSYTIPAGYHNGSGKVTANSLASQTNANATAGDIVKGKTAWVNGSKLTGTATVQSLGGYTKADIKNKGIVNRFKVVKQGETVFNTDGKSNMMYEVLQRYIDYIRSSGDGVCDILCIDNDMNNLIFCRSSGTVSTSHNEYHFDYLQYVNFNSFKTTNYISNHAYLPYDQVGAGKKYQSIPRTGNTKYGPLVISEHRSGSSDGDSWCTESTIRLQTKALTYDLLTLPHYGWLFNYSASSDTFTTIEDRKEGSQRKQYKVTYKIVPEVVDKDGNVIS